MSYHSTMFKQFLEPVNRLDFERLVKRENANKGCKGFDAYSQFVAMIFAQITNKNGLRSICASLGNQEYYHMGIVPPCKSTLSYANNHRPSEFWEKLFYSLLEKLYAGTSSKERQEIDKMLYAIDATVISLCQSEFRWAKYKGKAGGIKVHAKLNISKEIPEKIIITPANKCENTTLKEMDLKTGDVAVFDMGYNNYVTFRDFTNENITFVTRQKNASSYKILRENAIPERENDYKITKDQFIEVVVKENVKSPKTKVETGRLKLRRIVSRDMKLNKTVVLLTNDLKSSAEKIAMIYKRRWQIELFFKAIKQNLRVKKFYGTTRNAVETQVWIAMVAYLLYIALRESGFGTPKNFTHFRTEFPEVIFSRGNLIEWFFGLHPKSPPKLVMSSQMLFNFTGANYFGQ